MDWKLIPSLAALRAFEATARHQSYVAAARELNVTEAALRQHVNALSLFYETPLTQRNGRKISLTTDGQRLASGLSDGFGKIQTASENLLTRSTARPIRIALPPSFAENWLMPRLPDFWNRHPDIEVDLSPSIKPVDLSLGHHDLAIRYGHGNWPMGDAALIASGDYTIVAAPNHATLTKSNLANAVWLFEEGRNEHSQWAATHGINPDAPQHRSYPNNSLVLSAVKAGHGLSVQSWALVEKDVKDGILQAILREKIPTLGYYRYAQGPLSIKAAHFSNWLTSFA